MMASDDSANQKVFENLNIAIDDAFNLMTKSENMRRMGNNLILPMIVKRSRLGYGVTEDGKQRYKFPPLAKSTKDQRSGKLRFYTNKKTGKIFTVGEASPEKKARGVRRKKSLIAKIKAFFKPQKTRAKSSGGGKKAPRASNLSQFTSPGRSNITATGFLLDKGLTVKAKKAQIIISASNIPYKKNIFGEMIKNPPTASEVVDYLRLMGREFLQTTVTEDKKLENILALNIIDEVERSLTRKNK